MSVEAPPCAPPDAGTAPQPAIGFNVPQASSLGYPPPQQQLGNPGYIPPGQPSICPPQVHVHPAPQIPGQAITQQPVASAAGAEVWMQAPQGPPNCPPGLEYLTLIDQVLIHQKMELLEILSGFETENQYTVKNSMGQKMYSVKEQSNCCARYCCGPKRPFDLRIYDNAKNNIIHMHRPLACQACCFPCCLQNMEVFAPPGTLIGKVEQNWSFWKPRFSIKDADDNVVLRIQGPCFTCNGCGEIEFQVLSANGENIVGKISKQWSGLMKEYISDADNFGISFPLDLDVKLKAVMLGACFLIDFMFYEDTGNYKQGGRLLA